ncbi:MAG TPA: hypothetical protein VN019_04910, partial [Oxalicibacterium sp.]|nr:hypothetical protein [Oxalicibacterium sp.]
MRFRDGVMWHWCDPILGESDAPHAAAWAECRAETESATGIVNRKFPSLRAVEASCLRAILFCFLQRHKCGAAH